MESSPDQLFLEFQRILAGRYSLERELGRGGMGVVYLARDVALDRAVAIKLLPPVFAAQPTFRERFLREARTAARLSHPHIVPIHSVEEEQGFVFFVMGYIPGRTLGQRVRDDGPLRPDLAARVLREVAWALGYAHAQGVVHRDVKPDNILLEEPGGRALVSDFGIAQVATTEPVSGGHRAGTRGYMSPEQLLGLTVDGRSDLYSLGLVGVYALTGAGVAEGEDARDLLGVAPGQLRNALTSCLAAEADDRPATAEVLADGLVPTQVSVVEIPPALRVWLTRSQPIAVAATLWSLFMGISLVAIIGVAISQGSTTLLADLLKWGMVALAPWVVFALARLLETRQALGAGYDLRDLRDAVVADDARKREERLWNSAKSSRVGRIARGVTIGSVLAALILLGLAATGAFASNGAFLARAMSIISITAVVSGILGIILPGAWSRADTPLGRGVKFWKGRSGAWFAKFAGVGLGRRTRAEDAARRPTELHLANELEDLYDALPPALRSGLEDVPATIKRLTASAESLRGQVEASRALGQGGGVPQDRLREAVAAMENLRLGLLRLRTGAVSLEGFTTDLDAAREVGDRVDRLLDAKVEIDRGLKGPKTP